MAKTTVDAADSQEVKTAKEMERNRRRRRLVSEAKMIPQISMANFSTLHCKHLPRMT